MTADFEGNHSFLHPTFSCDGIDYDVLAYELVETIDDLSSLTLTLTRYGRLEDGYDADAPVAEKLLDQPGLFTLSPGSASGDDVERSFAGRVVEARAEPTESDEYRLTIVVRPPLWALSKRTDCRVFQQLDTQAIVTKVLVEAGIPQDRQKWTLTDSLTPRVYCVQYRETDLAFVQRLLAEEGIFYAFETIDGAGHVCFCDRSDGLGPIEGETTLGAREHTTIGATADEVKNLTCRHLVQSDKVHLRDYSPARPKLNLWADAEGKDDGAHALEIYDHPGRFDSLAVGKRRAQVLLESLQSQRARVTGETGAIRLLVGRTLTIADHPLDACNGEMLILSCRLRGRLQATGVPTDGFTAENWFEAMPLAAGPHRPKPRAASQTLAGIALATTTGAAGEEIHVNASGDVSIQYPWDRLGKFDEKSSLWVRTSQLPLGASMLLPRVGWEVTVAHFEGDIDRPYVMARLYNGEKPPPYALPAHRGKSTIKTDTTPGGGSANSVEFSDDKGDEAMSFGGSHDVSMDVGNNSTSTVSGNFSKTVGSNQSVNVTDSIVSSIGADDSITIGGNQSITSQTYLNTHTGGSFTLDIGGKRGLMVGGDHKRLVSGDSSLTVNGIHIDLIVGDVTDEVIGNSSHSVGAANVEITAADRVMTVGTSITETTTGLKVLATADARKVAITGAFTQMVGGALIYSVKGDKTDAAGATYLELAAGAQFVKADKLVFEAETMLTLVMGASIITMLPGIILVAGVSVKLDGPVTSPLLVMNN
jgi:type VI secretion system secreted protein VgrG